MKAGLIIVLLIPDISKLNNKFLSGLKKCQFLRWASKRTMMGSPKQNTLLKEHSEDCRINNYKQPKQCKRTYKGKNSTGRAAQLCMILELFLHLSA